MEMNKWQREKNSFAKMFNIMLRVSDDYDEDEFLFIQHHVTNDFL